MITNRRRFLKTATAGAAAVCAFPSLLGASGTNRKKPNVLFIAVDDMNTDGAFHSGIAQTPHLSRLASQGIVFKQAYCQYPWCSPSRSSLMTGMRPDKTRVFDLKYHFRSSLPDAVTLPQLFMNNGYYAARVGKIYHYSNPGGIGTSGLDDPRSWNEVVNPAGRDITLLGKTTNYTPDHNGYGSSIAYLSDDSGRDEDYTDGKVAQEAIRILEKRRDEPFFLGVGFYKPHCPYIVPKKYFDLYRPEDISVPELPADYPKSVPAPALTSTLPWPNHGVSNEHCREAKRAYYAAISFVDAQIGRVLDALDRLGLRDNTIVVFWSDHGYHLGENGLWFKESCFERAARVPVVISPPAWATAGQVCSRLVEHVDLYPTIAELAGLTPPADLQGASLVPLLQNPRAPWSRPAFTQVERQEGFPGWSVRTDRWRYTEWDEGRQGIELYDHQNDPGETNNLAHDPRHGSTIAELKVLVKQNWPVRVHGGKVLPAVQKA